MTAHMTLDHLIRNAFAFPALASQHQDAIAKAMRASEFKYPPLLPCLGKSNGYRNGRQNAILALLSDGKHRTLAEIGEDMDVEELKVLHSAIKRATMLNLILFYTMPNRKRVYRLSDEGRAALVKARANGELAE
jgi:hypothetical protein